MGALAVWIALSSLWSISTSASVREVERVLVYVAVALAVALVLRRGDGPGVLAGVLVGITLISGYALGHAPAPRSPRHVRRPAQRLPARGATRLLERARDPLDHGDRRRPWIRSALPTHCRCARCGGGHARTHADPLFHVLARGVGGARHRPGGGARRGSASVALSLGRRRGRDPVGPVHCRTPRHRVR